MVQGVEVAQASPKGHFGRYLALVAGILGILWLAGYLPTMRLAGHDGVLAMIIGSFLSVLGSLAGTMPFLWFRGQPPVQAVSTIMGAIAIRLAVVIFLALAGALSGLLPNAPFLIWVAISHAGLLIADIYYARNQISSRSGEVALAST